ncbi:MAG: MBL fold metallo-hydrolase [Ruthenibacterium lactatiformans]
MTHPHADHIGGMQAVLDAFPVDRRCLPDLQKRRCPLHPPS